MLVRLQTVPLHVRLSRLFPVFVVLLGLALTVSASPDARSMFAFTTLFDATVSTALLVWLFTPKAERQFRRLWGVVLVGAALTALVFPELRRWLLLDLLGSVVAVGFFLRGLRRPLPTDFNHLDDLERCYTFIDRLTRAPKLTRLLVFDVVLLSHLLVRPRLPAGRHFGTRYGATTGPMAGMFLFLLLSESLLTHLIVTLWSHFVAWMLTGVSGLAALWLLAYARALAVRPITIGKRRLYLRSGLQWTGSTSLANVVEARPFKQNENADAHSIAVGNTPNITLIFRRPVHLYGPYWVEANAQKIALQVDDAQGFLAALTDAMSSPHSSLTPFRLETGYAPGQQ